MDLRRHLPAVQFIDVETNRRRVLMIITTEHLSPMIALIAGILILILPSLLNYVIALYLIITGLMGLNAIYHFVG